MSKKVRVRGRVHYRYVDVDEVIEVPDSFDNMKATEDYKSEEWMLVENQLFYLAEFHLEDGEIEDVIVEDAP